MPRLYTAEELIDSVELRAAVPGTTATGSAPADILRYLNEEQFSTLIPWLLQTREEYFVITERVVVETDLLRYRIPHRAMGQLLRDLLLVDTLAGDRRLTVPRVAREKIPFYDTDFLSDIEGFYLEGNDIVLLDIDTSNTGALEMSYYFRPGELVLSTEGRVITAVNLSTKTITVATSPSTWASTDKFDIHSGKSGAEIRQFDLTSATPGSQTAIIFNEDIDDTVFGRRPVEVGDYVCLAEEAVLPGLPREVHPVLVQAAACRLLEARGDTELLAAGQKTLGTMMKMGFQFIEKRVRGKQQKIVGSYEGFGGSTYRGRGWY